MPGSVLLIAVLDADQRRLFNRMLGSTAHHIVYTEEGPDAIDRFVEVKPDLVIAHAELTDEDGGALFPRIREEQSGNVTPLVLLGERINDNEALARRVQQADADGYLPLPFDRRTLLESIMPLLTFGRPRSPEMLEQDALDDGPEPTTHVGDRNPEPVTVPADDSVSPTPMLGTQPSTDLLPVAVVRLATDEEIAEGEVPDVMVVPASDAEDLPDAAFGHSQDTLVGVNPFAEGQAAHGAEDAFAGERGGEAGRAPDAATAAKIGAEVRAGVPVSAPQVTPENEPRARPKPRSDLSRKPVSERRLESRRGSGAASELRREEPAPAAEGDPLAEPRIPDGAPERAALLAEPSFAGSSSGVVPRGDLLEERRREGTPSAVRPSAEHEGARRGLDEAQLGRRIAKRVHTTFERMASSDHFEILGVDRNAPEETVRLAYLDLSLEFHPDRFFQLRSGDLKEKIYAIYRRIADAYAVLSDERRRAAYIAMLDDGRPRRPREREPRA